jgi:hypothetical protein
MPNEVEVPKPEFYVYRKGFFWGESFFCICDEVLYYEETVLMKLNNQVIAILPKNAFSCAISMKSSRQV